MPIVSGAARRVPTQGIPFFVFSFSISYYFLLLIIIYIIWGGEKTLILWALAGFYWDFYLPLLGLLPPFIGTFTSLYWDLIIDKS